MATSEIPRRLLQQPRLAALGREVPVAVGLGSRLLGLALLDRGRAGPGLLIPRCRSVHTFGMRFRLDIHFLDAGGDSVSIHRGVPPNRIVWDRRAAAALELPSPVGGEVSESPT